MFLLVFIIACVALGLNVIGHLKYPAAFLLGTVAIALAILTALILDPGTTHLVNLH